MTNALRKAIMKRSESDTTYVKSKTSENLVRNIKSKENFVLNCIKKKEENIMRN